MMEELQTQLKSNLLSFAQTKNIKVTEEVEQNMDDYVSQVVSVCKSSVSNSFLEDFLGYSSLFTKIALIAVPLSLVMIAYCTWIIYKNSSKRHKFRLLRYYATAAGASGLVLVIVPIVLNLLDLDKKLIGIDVQYKYNVASSFLNLSFQSMILSGIALLVIQILLVATWLVLVNKRKS
ncbi:hypothetical protein SDC9_151784 [bioreactor metagenome]|uniref:Uncharacterized protein n=1 Tax=bioreactor metagenome TaxID=1076179 RepID=A0A645EVL0_9ZZZZ